eukprot:SAG11_NODE_7034_length_1205_cov_1.239602_1_plen_23_part_10
MQQFIDSTDVLEHPALLRAIDAA